MLDMNDDRRTSKRRKMARRMHDMLHGIVPEIDLLQYDLQLFVREIGADRRTQQRRSDGDRRAGSDL